MLKNYLIVLFRNFKRNKAFTLINISGLTLGITCSLIMFLIVKEELSFNKYHSNLDSIYRIGHIDIVDGQEYTQGGVPMVMDAAVEEEIVGVKESTLVSHEMYGLVSIEKPSGEIKYYEENPELVYVEQNFFDVFDWEVIEGSLKDNFSEPNIGALNQTLAAKYFPGESAIGKVVRLNKKLDFKVVAVVEDAPDNSDFPFGFFMTMATKLANEDVGRWGSISSNNVLFVQLEKGADAAQVEAQFPDFVKRHWDNEDPEWRSFVLSPLGDYHFDERFGTFGTSSSKQMLWAYALIGAFLIVTACFNFINMSTAMAVKRAKEVGMRKVLGSSRKQLITRFLGETFFITLISILLSMGLTERLLPLVINEFVELNIAFQPLQDLSLLTFLISILVSVTLLAGFYPAIVLSSAKPIYALKGAMDKRGNGMGLRRVLVVFQFFLCQLLIFGTIVMVRQMDFFRSVDMGYDKDWVLTINMPEGDVESQNRWEADIKQLPGVASYSFNSKPPFSGSISGTNAFYNNSDTSRLELNVQYKSVDQGYLDTYGLRLIAGEWLPDRDTIAHYVVNQSAVKKMGIKDPNDAIGEIINMWGLKYPIVGVVEDFHAITLSSQIEPMILCSNKPRYETLGLKVNAASAEQVISSLEDTWYNIHEEYEFDYVFLDENIEAYYETEKKMSQMLTVFAGIAIFIGCLGLYGLVAFMANQRAKEIGIRKVLGASVANIVKGFSWEFTKLVIIAFLIAAPLGYFGIGTWLDQYAYRITVGPAIFLFSIGASLLIAFITTGYRSGKAAVANPVNSLRDE